MEYGYIRVSTSNQNIDRQFEAIVNEGICIKNIYIDYESGKDFNRQNYQKLLRKIKKNDLIVIKSIDRLGRNYNMIIDEWRLITKEKQADIKVLDMPLLDTRVKGDNLVGKFISDIVLQVLSFVAQNERENIKQRQAEGIKIAKEKGVKFGRPQVKLPANFNEIANMVVSHTISIDNACKILKMSKGTLYKYLKINLDYIPRRYTKK